MWILGLNLVLIFYFFQDKFWNSKQKINFISWVVKQPILNQTIRSNCDSNHWPCNFWNKQNIILFTLHWRFNVTCTLARMFTRHEVWLVIKGSNSPGQWGHWGSSRSAEEADASSGPEHSPAAGHSETHSQQRQHSLFSIIAWLFNTPVNFCSWRALTSTEDQTRQKCSNLLKF